ncbi:hypothetical protein [Atlantibacter sp.]|uniref:hypothetical protein n=1 Tax=Atlantibacter sp. TaxID=1903473 RepID=UPI0028AF01D0|nr:hypothetical protein [Atlantibacter sp.]
MKLLPSLFSSPEKLLQVISQGDVQDAIDDGERIIIDGDGNAMVNIHCVQVQQDFERHVETLKRA